MCYVCNCFAWTLDLIQRALTFCLSCWLTFAVCVGLAVATFAGVAYGYNYSLAEFITLARSDVNVNMRRGQLNDKPDLMYPKRRVGDDENDDEYYYQQEVPSIDNSALSDKWQKKHDTQKYGEKLTKYSDSRSNLVDYEQVKLPQTTKINFVTPTLSIVKNTTPKTLFSTRNKLNDLSNLVMRMFEPIQETKSKTKYDFDRNEGYKRRNFEDNIKYNEKNKANRKVNPIRSTKIGILETESVSPDIRIVFEDDHKSTFVIKTSHSWTSTPLSVREYLADVDEDNIAYKSLRNKKYIVP